MTTFFSVHWIILKSRVANFFLVQHAKTGTHLPNEQQNIPNEQKNIPIGHKTSYEMALRYSCIFRSMKFGMHNNPSGNPALKIQFHLRNCVQRYIGRECGLIRYKCRWWWKRSEIPRCKSQSFTQSKLWQGMGPMYVPILGNLWEKGNSYINTEF
jgi:hypothetical protein